ncbi:hypothetical protein OG738_01275 [Amycolatopsis sp. NBC_01488]
MTSAAKYRWSPTNTGSSSIVLTSRPVSTSYSPARVENPVSAHESPVTNSVQ